MSGSVSTEMPSAGSEARSGNTAASGMSGRAGSAGVGGLGPGRLADDVERGLGRLRRGLLQRQVGVVVDPVAVGVDEVVDRVLDPVAVGVDVTVEPVRRADRDGHRHRHLTRDTEDVGIGLGHPEGELVAAGGERERELLGQQADGPPLVDRPHHAQRQRVSRASQPVDVIDRAVGRHPQPVEVVRTERTCPVVDGRPVPRPPRAGRRSRRGPTNRSPHPSGSATSVDAPSRARVRMPES